MDATICGTSKLLRIVEIVVSLKQAVCEMITLVNSDEEESILHCHNMPKKRGTKTYHLTG